MFEMLGVVLPLVIVFVVMFGALVRFRYFNKDKQEEKND